MTERRKAVLITGASSGIGEACALHLDKEGYRVFAGVRSEAAGSDLHAKASGALVPVLLDVTDSASIEAAYRRIDAEIADTGLAGLVNNAGLVVSGPLEFLPMAEFKKQMDVNVTGQLAVTQAFLPLLRRASGRVINMGSVAGKSALPFLGPYSASKFALEALTDSLRLELRPWGIRVSIIEPGSIATPIWGKSLNAVESMSQGFSPLAWEYYGNTLLAMLEASRHSARKAISPMKVVEAVQHALTAKRPKTRYVIGRDAKLRLLLRLLPDHWVDEIIARRFAYFSVEYKRQNSPAEPAP